MSLTVIPPAKSVKCKTTTFVHDSSTVIPPAEAVKCKTFVLERLHTTTDGSVRAIKEFG
jgi:hypothetical protein